MSRGQKRAFICSPGLHTGIECRPPRVDMDFRRNSRNISDKVRAIIHRETSDPVRRIRSARHTNSGRSSGQARYEDASRDERFFVARSSPTIAFVEFRRRSRGKILPRSVVLSTRALKRLSSSKTDLDGGFERTEGRRQVRRKI